jgi:hypothetical protein
MNIDQIEDVLRRAPRLTPPSGLKDRLLGDITLTRAREVRTQTKLASDQGSWLRRWWPVLASGSVSLACAASLTVQQIQVQQLKATTQALARGFASPGTGLGAAAVQANTAGTAANDASVEQQEIARLKQLAARLAAEVAHLEQLQAENQQLRAQLTAAASAIAAAAREQDTTSAREQAAQTACVNNLKQLGLAGKVYSLDASNTYPEHVLDMTNEMSTPKILVCPADTGRQAAANWGTYTAANCSYEYFAAGANSEREPMRIMFRCPIHGNITLFDGSVQGRVGKIHPESIVSRNGKIYFEPPPMPAAGAPSN